MSFCAISQLYPPNFLNKGVKLVIIVMALKLVKTTPFTIEEIWERFNELAPLMVKTYEVEEKILKDENGEWLVEYKPNEPDANEEIKNAPTQTVVKTRVRRNKLFNQDYDFTTWMRRILCMRDAPKSNQEGMFRKAYLHSLFRWWYKITVKTEGGWSEDLDKMSVNHAGIGRWLSWQWGFSRWNEQVVQVNPAELFAITFMPPEKRKFAITEVRLISEIPDGTSNWAFDRFRYYTSKLMGDPFLSKRGVPCSSFSDHWLLKEGMESNKYMKNKGCSKDELLQNILPLGVIVEMGFNSKIWERMDGANIEELQERWSQELPQYNSGDWKSMVFTHGYALFQNRLPVNLGELGEDVTPETQGLAGYFVDLAKKGKSTKSHQPYFRPLSEVKEDMKKFQYFDVSTIHKKKFITEFLIPKLERLDFVVEQQTKKVDGTNTRVLVVEAPKYGKRKG